MQQGEQEVRQVSRQLGAGRAGSAVGIGSAAGRVGSAAGRVGRAAGK